MWGGVIRAVSQMRWQTSPDLPLHVATTAMADYIGRTWAMFITQKQLALATDSPHGWWCALLALSQATPAAREASGL